MPIKAPGYTSILTSVATTAYAVKPVKKIFNIGDKVWDELPYNPALKAKKVKDQEPIKLNDGKGLIIDTKI